ncbi:Smr/MutS family protein [bacterium]|nr:Smr/MutS family protein [bacterium]
MKKKYKRNQKQKINKFDNLSKPQAELDFHNRGVLYPEDIKELVDVFIQKSIDKNLTKILFITGKGLHSKKGMPVIKPLVKKYLQTKPEVKRVYEGRFDRGGSGTLEVTLEY